MTGPFRRFKNSSMNDKLLYVVLLGISAFLFLAYLLSALRSAVNADAGYYLGVTELVHEGYVPYRDFGLSYTPMFFYVLQLPRMLMGSYPDYTGYMLFLYLIVAVDAFLVAILVKKITNSVKFAWLSAVLFLLLYLYLDGAYFILETFSLCCGLVSMALLVGRENSFWRCFLSGVFCALAFLSKQYGLLFAGFVGVLLLLSKEEWKRRILNCLFVFAGFAVILILFISFFVFSGLGLKDLVGAVSGSTYGGQSIRMYFNGVIKTCRLFPYLLFIPCILFYRKNDVKFLVWACCASLLLASFQFYFNVFPHYYIYMLPFILILVALMLGRLKLDKQTPIVFLLYFGVLFTACAVSMQSVYKDTRSLVKHDLRAVQEKTTLQLRQTMMTHKLDSALCYWNTIQYYGLCPLNPSAMTKYGFAFGSDTEESLLSRLEEADCFIIHTENLGEISEMNELSKALSDSFVLLDDKFADGTKVFVRSK